MQKLHFSANHNGKLFLDHFPTIRLHNPGKYHVGNTLEVSLKSTPIGIVSVVAVRSFRFKQISDVLSFIDCGKPAPYLAGLLKLFYQSKTSFDGETLLDHVILQYQERHLTHHSLLLQEWWNEKMLNQTQISSQPQFKF